MKKIAEEWLNAAADDLAVVRSIRNNPQLTHMTSFHAQQCIEKTFKAVLEEQGLIVLKIHNLINLHGKIAHVLKIDIDPNILKTLDQLYIDSRYPGSLGLLPNGKPSMEVVEGFIRLADEIYSHVRKLL